MTEHRTWVETDVSADGGGEMWQAVCEGCPWSSRWVHADEFGYLVNGVPLTSENLDEDGTVDTDGELTTPADQATGHAKVLGQQHVTDNTDEDETP